VSLYACQAFAADGVTCTSWSVVNPHLLPPLSATDGAELASLIIGVWVIAVCGRYLVHRFQRS